MTCCRRCTALSKVRSVNMPSEDLGEDPFVGAMTRFTTLVQRAAASSGGRIAVLAAGAIVAVAIMAAIWQWSSRHGSETVAR